MRRPVGSGRGELDFEDWKTYEDISPFIHADTVEVDVIEELSGRDDGHRKAVIQAEGPIDFAGPKSTARILLDLDEVESLISVLSKARDLLKVSFKEEE